MGENKKNTQRGHLGEAGSLPPPKLSAAAVHDVAFFKRKAVDDPDRAVPSLASLRTFPPGVRRRILATLAAVAEAPPTRFAGGGAWEAMHGGMSGYFEVRVKYRRMLYRVFCLLDTSLDARIYAKPVLAVIDAESKPDGTAIPASRYEQVRALGSEYKSPDERGRHIRSLADRDDLARYGF